MALHAIANEYDSSKLWSPAQRTFLTGRAFVLPLEANAARRDDRPEIRELGTRLKSRLSKIITPEMAVEDGSLLAIPGRDGDADRFLLTYQVDGQGICVVIGEFDLTVLLGPSATGVPLATGDDVAAKYLASIRTLFSAECDTFVVVEKAERLWYAVQRTRAAVKAQRPIYMPWDWSESIRAAFDDQGNWALFTLKYRLVKRANSLFAGERLRFSGSWFDDVVAGKKYRKTPRSTDRR